jgi:hypothetical protein
MRVPEFIEECIERSGGAVAHRGPGLFDVLLPPELEQMFGRGLLAVAADPAALQAEAHAELATPGSPFVDQLIAWASARGTATRALLPAGRLKRKGLREEVERSLLFSNCRVRYDADEPRVLSSHYAQFNFRVTFLSDEKRERVYIVPVNLWSNQVNLLLAERLGGMLPAADDVSYAETAAVPAEQAYPTAQAALRRRVAEEAGRHRERIEKRFGVEHARVCAYYDQLAQELASRRRGDESAESRTPDHKLAAAAVERERKLHELGEKHQLRVRARLASTRLLVQAKTYFTLLVDRGSATRHLTLCYDSLLERLEPPVCEACRGETTRVHVDAEARMLCRACAQVG